jgi:hypothetical protein
MHFTMIICVLPPKLHSVGVGELLASASSPMTIYNKRGNCFYPCFKNEKREVKLQLYNCPHNKKLTGSTIIKDTLHLSSLAFHYCFTYYSSNRSNHQLHLIFTNFSDKDHFRQEFTYRCN